jgi:hypothetical protein
MLAFHPLQPLRETPDNASEHFTCHIPELLLNARVTNTVFPGTLTTIIQQSYDDRSNDKYSSNHGIIKHIYYPIESWRQSITAENFHTN